MSNKIVVLYLRKECMGAHGMDIFNENSFERESQPLIKYTMKYWPINIEEMPGCTQLRFMMYHYTYWQ